MRSTFVSRAFSALVYCQALLLVAGVASVVLRDRPAERDAARTVAVHGLSAEEIRL